MYPHTETDAQTADGGFMVAIRERSQDEERLVRDGEGNVRRYTTKDAAENVAQGLRERHPNWNSVRVI